MSVDSVERPKTLIYRVAVVVVRIYFFLFYRVRVFGVEHIPKVGGVIIASNHVSNLDPPLVGIFVPRYVRLMAKEELFQIGILRKLFFAIGGFPVRRRKIDIHAIRTAVEVVSSGGCLVMFPEGHRSKDGQLKELMPGIAAIARKGGAAIVPTAVIGPYRLFRRLDVRYGKPLILSGLSNDEIMAMLKISIEGLLRETGRES